jgi:hypothetical protein
MKSSPKTVMPGDVATVEIDAKVLSVVDNGYRVAYGPHEFCVLHGQVRVVRTPPKRGDKVRWKTNEQALPWEGIVIGEAVIAEGKIVIELPPPGTT